MATVSIRDLARNASGVVKQVAESGRPALVTRHGAPVVALVPIDQDDLEEFVLSKSSLFAEDFAAADEDLRTGRTRPTAEVFADLDAE